MLSGAPARDVEEEAYCQKVRICSRLSQTVLTLDNISRTFTSD